MFEEWWLVVAFLMAMVAVSRPAMAVAMNPLETQEVLVVAKNVEQQPTTTGRVVMRWCDGRSFRSVFYPVIVH